MDYSIRNVTEQEFTSALKLALKVFMKYEAPDYGEEGILTFKRDIIDSQSFLESLLSGKNVMFGAFDGDTIIGLIATRRTGHIGLVFVDDAYQRKGIATAIMKTMMNRLKEDGFSSVTLNSSPYGLPFYHRFGFTDLDKEQTKDGITYTPMCYKIG